MKRGTVIGATGGLIAGVSLGAVALAAPAFGLFNQSASSSGAAAAAQLALPAISQQARWGNLPNLADLVQAVSPSVVQIQVRSASPVRQSQFQGRNPFEGTPFEDYFGAPGQGGQGGQGQQEDEAPDRMGSGSGFFIEGGYIVTNNHVVNDAKKMTVVFEDGREMEGTLVGTDPKTDLAVLKVSGTNIPRGLPWGASANARPGDSVFAVGSPFGLGNTVTAGIVSARGRNINSGQYDDFIQVDAPINQGNSGGPLFDQSGSVIGVNSAIYSPTGGNVGIGFSIPSDLAKGIVAQLIAHGSVERGWLGVSIGPVTPDIASSLNLASSKGAMVQGVTDGSPAAKAGVKEGDVILHYGDREIGHVQDLTRAVADTKAGTTRDLKIMRDGRPQTLKVNIDALKDDTAKPQLASASPTPGPSTTLDLADLGLGLASRDGALVVSSVKVNSAAADAGIRVGDKLVKVNQTNATSADVAKKAVDDAKKQNRNAVLLQLQRNDTRFFVGVPFSGK
jgi:serine protease Do